jgi:hypothetical protein
VIALRAWLERTSKRRWVGPLVIVLLVLLLAFVALHAVHDQALQQEAVECVVAFFAIAVVFLVVRICAEPVSPARRTRPPPVIAVRARPVRSQQLRSFRPLRL